MSGHEQLLLPTDVLSIAREVYWFSAVQVEKRHRLLGKKVVTRLIYCDDDLLPKVTRIDSGNISAIKDPNLRYALRYADAAEAVGWIVDGDIPGMQSRFSVTIEATDESMDSRLLGAGYAGVVDKGVDTFMENLQRLAPGYDENHSGLTPPERQ